MADPIVKAPPTASSDWSRPLRRGGGAVLLAVLGIGIWAAYAPLDSAILAPGQVAVENSRQTVQHFEGGMIKEIHVRDGQLVQAGDLLFRFDETQARATFDTLSNQLGVFLAREARLMAERENLSEVQFADEILRSTDANVVRAITDERASFRERAGLKKVQLDVFHNRIATFEREIEGLKIERDSSERQIKLIDQELVGLRELYAKQLVPLTRLNAMERERERLSQIIARSMTDTAKAERNIGEVRLQIAQLEADFQKQAVSELIDVRRAVAETIERRNVARDVFTRLDIRAPMTGIAQARKFSTIGAVVRPGDAMVEIAPINQNLVIRAQVDPRDIDVLRLGQRAEVRFPNFKASEAPTIFGNVRALSNDRIQDERNPQVSYFFVEVLTEFDKIPTALRERIRTGMPADVTFPTGERSAARYFLQPLEERIRNAFRER
jgi:HlyD family secretion protein